MATDATVLVAGETLVDFVPATSTYSVETTPSTDGDDSNSGAYERRFGGAPANVALAMARFGNPPLFWTRLADDDFGQFLRERLLDGGVPDDLLVADADARTTLAVVSHDETGDRTFTFYREGGAEGRLEAGTVTDARLESVEWVHTSGVPMSVEPSRTATLDLQARASETATVSLDPNWRPELWHSAAEYRAVVRGALEHVDVLTASASDLHALGFDDDPEAMARSVTEHGPHTAVITLGGDGALCYGTPRSPVAGFTRHEGYDVDVVDATGAGDAFLAGFLTAVASGVTDGRRALALGNAAGAVVTTRPGAVTALTGLDDLRRFHVEIPWTD